MGTGVWDDEVFFHEPSLQGAIFPGIPKEKREDYFNQYLQIYNEKPIRTITIIYDLVGLLSYIVSNQLTTYSTINLLNDNIVTFDGMDGKFSFEDNLIKRQLYILKISNGTAQLIR